MAHNELLTNEFLVELYFIISNKNITRTKNNHDKEKRTTKLLYTYLYEKQILKY